MLRTFRCHLFRLSLHAHRTRIDCYPQRALWNPKSIWQWICNIVYSAQGSQSWQVWLFSLVPPVFLTNSKLWKLYFLIETQEGQEDLSGNVFQPRRLPLCLDKLTAAGAYTMVRWERYSPENVKTNTHIDTIHEILLLDWSKLSIKSLKKTPNDLMMPYVKTSTKKNETATAQPHPPSGTCVYTLALQQSFDFFWVILELKLKTTTTTKISSDHQ